MTPQEEIAQLREELRFEHEGRLRAESEARHYKRAIERLISEVHSTDSIVSITAPDGPASA